MVPSVNTPSTSRSSSFIGLALAKQERQTYPLSGDFCRAIALSRNPWVTSQSDG
jgi:hypothetical protein